VEALIVFLIKGAVLGDPGVELLEVQSTLRELYLPVLVLILASLKMVLANYLASWWMLTASMLMVLSS
jgi:hypothetical protein